MVGRWWRRLVAWLQGEPPPQWHWADTAGMRTQADLWRALLEQPDPPELVGRGSRITQPGRPSPHKEVVVYDPREQRIFVVPRKQKREA